MDCPVEDTGRSVNMALAESGGGGDGLLEKADKLEDLDDSSDSENEGDSKAFHRRISTNKEIKNGVCIKEGYLMKQTSSFQRWQRRYFKLKGRKLYYGKDAHCLFYEEVELAEVSVAEKSVKNVNHTFQVISPFRNLVLCAESRKEMEDWILALKSTMNQVFYDPNDHHAMMSGLHNWYVSSHARPTYCNVCREALSGVTFHGLSCGVCKFKAHKRCAVKAPNNCKWITLANVGSSIIENDDGSLSMCHQWLEGNLPVNSAKCALCDKTCGSVRRLQDWRCLWCKATVHSACKDLLPEACPLCQCHISVVPPTAIHSIDSDGFWEAMRPAGTSPLLVFVNSKSGDNQGVKFLRRFKQLLNPAQVFDLMNGGPYPGLRLFQRFDQFRILVCGGDGSIGWVLSEIDKLDLQRQCQIGVLPLGTGNDLARVLGWGSVMTDDNQLLSVIEKLEHSQIKMLDRWSIMTYEEHELPILMKGNHVHRSSNAAATSAADGSSTAGITSDMIARYEDSVADHLSKILHSTDHSTVISSAKVLCETVRNFVTKVAERQHEATLKPAPAAAEIAEQEDSIADKCANLHGKLDLLLRALGAEESLLLIGVEHGDRELPEGRCSSNSATTSTEPPPASSECCGSQGQESAHLKEIVMSRANSIKKSVRQIIEHTERAVEEQYAQMEDLPLVALQRRTRSQPRGDQGTRSGGGGGSGCRIDESKSRQPTMAGMPSSTVSSVVTSDACSTSTKPSAPGAHPTTTQRQQSVPRSPRSSDHRGSESKSPRSPSRRISAMSTLAPAAAAFTRDRSPEGVGGLSYATVGAGSSSASGSVPPWLPLTTSLRVNSSIASNLAGGSFISKMLLANADALCACASPLVADSVSLEHYEEKCIMNNYFGVGLDAKIALEFHNKREEHPEKCRSRTKNLMWFGVIGGKEIIQQTYRNLEQRVLLECDGQQLPLPNLQGIVVLNIPSYMGGANFWGSSRYKEGETFITQCFDDRILEVVAVFGSAQLGVSRIVNLQHHRIAQCRTVKITIKGDEPVPVQVDGEAWLQPPGFIRIVHKNRAQMLTRDRSFENTLRQWSEKQKVTGLGATAASSALHDRTLNAHGLSGGDSQQQQLLPLTFDELETVEALTAAATVLIEHVRASPALLTEDVRALAAQLELCLERARTINKEHQTKATKDHVVDLIDRAKLLCNEVTQTLGNDNSIEPDSPLTASPRTLVLGAANGTLCDIMANVDSEAQKLAHLLLQDATSAPGHQAAGTSVAAHVSTSEDTRRKHHRFNIVSRFRSIAGGNGSGRRMAADKDRPSPPASCAAVEAPACYRAYEWTIEDIGSWLSSMGMAEYKDTFARNDIRGAELLHLERKDLKDLGISKVGHLKRLQRAIEEMAALAAAPPTAGGSVGSGSSGIQQPLLLSS